MSKKNKVNRAGQPPNEEAFAALLGTYDEEVVLDAYEIAFDRWVATAGTVESNSDDIAQERPEPAAPSLGGRMILRRRQRMFRAA